jgi:hypothetical protein
MARSDGAGKADQLEPSVIFVITIRRALLLAVSACELWLRQQDERSKMLDKG